MLYYLGTGGSGPLLIEGRGRNHHVVVINGIVQTACELVRHKNIRASVRKFKHGHIYDNMCEVCERAGFDENTPWVGDYIEPLHLNQHNESMFRSAKYWENAILSSMTPEQLIGIKRRSSNLYYTDENSHIKIDTEVGVVVLSVTHGEHPVRVSNSVFETKDLKGAELRHIGNENAPYLILDVFAPGYNSFTLNRQEDQEAGKAIFKCILNFMSIKHGVK